MALVGLSFALSISAAEISTGILIIWWLWRVWRSPKPFLWQSSPLDIPLAVYYVWGVFSALFNRSVGFTGALTRYDSILLFLLLGRGIEKEDRNTIVSWFLVGSVVAGILGVIQHFTAIDYKPTPDYYVIPAFFQSWPRGVAHYMSAWNGRSVGTRNHPLTYSEGLIPAFLILFASLFVKFTEKPRRTSLSLLYLFVGVCCVGLGIFYSQSRGVFVGIAGGLAVVGYFWRHRLSRKILLFGGLATAFAFLLTSSSMNARILSIVSPSVGSSADQQSRSTRLELWRQSWASIKARPFVGVGLEGAHFVTHDTVTGQDLEWSESHNIYLQTAVDTGWIGLGLFIWVLVSMASLVSRMEVDLKGPFAAIVVGFLLAGLTESWLGDREISIIFWVFVGWMDSHRIHREKRISLWPDTESVRP